MRKHAEEAKVKEEESSITYNDKTDVEEVTTEKVAGLLDSGELVEMKQLTEDNLSTEEVNDVETVILTEVNYVNKSAEKVLVENKVTKLDEKEVTETSNEVSTEKVEESCVKDEITTNNDVEEDTTVVHAVATIESSPFTDLTEDDIKSLKNFIVSEQHLERNILKTEFERLSKWEIAVEIYIDNSRLWEEARPYIWKHLEGSNFWTRSNGAVITNQVSRIHVK